MEHYFRLVEGGHARVAYKHVLSTRCRRVLTFKQFDRAASEPVTKGTSIQAFRRNPTHGSVLIHLPTTPNSPLAWHWIKQDGVWRDDGCPPN